MSAATALSRRPTINASDRPGPRPGATGNLGTSGIPADAADWLRAHFDWTRGAVWVACERWRVDAATVVAWAERLRCGGARAGLGGKERAWIVAQLSDPEQRPTRVESAMARTWARGLVATPPLAIRSVHDAIALLEARVADDLATGDGHSDDPFRALLLDDLRALRDGRRDEPEPVRAEPVRDEQRDETPEQKVSETTMATHATAYSTRETVCPQCGKTFVARKYSTGWTTYCSRSCGVKGQRAAQQATGQAMGAFPGTGLSNSAPSAQQAAQPVAQPEDSITAAEAMDIPEPLLTQTTTVPAPTSGPTAASEHVSIPTMFAPMPHAQAADTDTRPARPTPLETARLWPLLTALLGRLPASGEWGAGDRERWLRAFTATLDLEVTTTNDAHEDTAPPRERTEA